MKLFTKDIDRKLFAQYSKGSDLENQQVVAKIFNPYGRGVWYVINSDPNDPDYLWAIVDLFEVEVGSVSRSELETIKVPPFGLHLERDLSFRPMNAAELFRGALSGKRYAEGGETESSENKEMIENQAQSMGHHVGELKNALKDADEVDAWVVAKAQRAATDLSDITHYLEGENKEYADGGKLGYDEETLKDMLVGKSVNLIPAGMRTSEMYYKITDVSITPENYRHRDLFIKLEGSDYEERISMDKIADFLRGEDVIMKSPKDPYALKLVEPIMGLGGEYGVDKHRVYFSSFAEVMEAINDIAEDNGYEIKEIFPDLSYGGVSYGQTKRATAELEWNGKEKRGKSKKREKNTLNIQIYRMGSGNYELNTYFSYEHGGYMENGGETFAKDFSTWNFWKEEYEENIKELEQSIKSDYDDDEVSHFTRREEEKLEEYKEKLQQHLEKGEQMGWYASGGYMAKGAETEKPISYYKYETPKVTIYWKGKPQPLGRFKSAEEAYEVIKKQSDRYGDIKDYEIHTPDKIIKLASGGYMAKGGGFDQYGEPYGFDYDGEIPYEWHYKEGYEKPYKVWDKIDGEYIAEFTNRQSAIEFIERKQMGFAKGGYMAKGGESDMLKEGDYVWNALGKKLVVDKVTDEEYYLSGFMQVGSSPWSKSKVHQYIKSGKWSLKPKMASGGYMENGGETDKEKYIKEYFKSIEIDESETPVNILKSQRKLASKQYEKDLLKKSSYKKFKIIYKIPAGATLSKIVEARTPEEAKNDFKKYHGKDVKGNSSKIISVKLFEDKMASGGKVKFKDKVASIKQSLLERKKVPPAVQKDYGKLFNEEEADDSARRIAGSRLAKERMMQRRKK